MAEVEAADGAMVPAEPLAATGSRPEWEVLSEGGCTWICQLGHGQYGTVHLVSSAQAPVAAGGGGDREGNAVAKVVFLDHLKDRDRALALQEVEVLRKLQHPNIVQHYSSWLHTGNASASGAGKQEALVTLMEYCAGGDLRQCLDEYARREEFLSEGLVLSLFVQLLEAMRHVHSHKILHRDLKTSNILLTADRRTVKIGDFGIARVLDNTAAVALTMLGTPYYMSPEVCKGEPYREKSDIWSLGCVLYEMCVLRHAFESQSLLGLVYCIVSECYAPIPADRYSTEVADLVACLLVKAADERPSADEALRADVLQPYLAAAPVTGGQARPGTAPPPPPPPNFGACGEGPLPPPSPGRSDSSAAPPPTPPGEIDTLMSMPALLRPAPPPPGAGSTGGPRREIAGERRGPSPTRRTHASSRTLADLHGSSRPAAAWTDAPLEVQILLARSRRALLRRPRSRGNWVLAFAQHDTTGAGTLACEQFAGFLASLDLGLSGQEVESVADGLAQAAGGGVSLGDFSEAITHAAPSDPRWTEAWALDAVRALAAGPCAGGGLASLAGTADRDVLDAMPVPLAGADDSAVEAEEEAGMMFLLWLPKTPDGVVDWRATEEWLSGA